MDDPSDPKGTPSPAHDPAPANPPARRDARSPTPQAAAKAARPPGSPFPGPAVLLTSPPGAKQAADADTSAALIAQVGSGNGRDPDPAPETPLAERSASVGTSYAAGARASNPIKPITARQV